MATFSDLMRLKLELDSREFSSGLDKAGKDAKDTFDDIGDDAEGTASRFSGIGGKMGKALVAGFSAIGAGALIMQGIGGAMEASAGRKQIQGMFALTADEAERFGKIAGDVYADGWGEGLQDVQRAVALTSQKLKVDNEDALQAISTQILAVSQTWGEDFDAVVRSTNQLIENDLAPNAQAALDLIVAAFQEGGNEAGDLLDTIDEYSQHWSAMGLSGEDALNQIISGFQNGQRDADKMADAVKEMRIRIVENSDAVRSALENLGLNADQVVNAFIEGDPAAKGAFLQVIDALADGQAQGDDTANAVALIGTQFEDLGPKALTSLAAVDGALQETTGRAAELAETVEANEFDEMKRDWEVGLTEVVEGAAGVWNSGMRNLARNAAENAGNMGLAEWIDGGEEAFSKADQFLRDFDRSLLDNVATLQEARDVALEHAAAVLDNADAHGMGMTPAMMAALEISNEWNAAQEAAAKETQIASEMLRDEAKAANAAADGLEVVEEAHDATAEATERLRQELQDLIDEVNDAIDSEFDLEKATLQLENANIDLERSYSDLVKMENDGETSASDLRKARNDLRLEEIQLAEDARATAAAFAESQGAQEGSARHSQLMRDELDRLAAKYPHLRDEIARYIDELNRIPRSISTVVNLSRGRSFSLPSSGGRSAGGTGMMGIGAEGAVVDRPTLSVIGEAGPEAVVPLHKMPGASPVESILGGSGGGSITVPVTINVKGELIDERTIRRLYDAAPDAFAQAVRRANAHANRFNP